MPQQQLRILWVSNATWAPTGYGQQSALTLPRLRALGYEIAEMPYYGYAGAKQELDGNTYYGVGHSEWGDDQLPHAARDFRADIAITLMDIWVLPDDMWVNSGVRWVPWTPIDHEPCPYKISSRLSTAYKPIAMSRFGQRMMEAESITPTYIPHGIDTKTLYPLPQSERDDFKEYLGFERDDFVVGMVAANKGWPSRKGFTEAFDAFARFHEEVPKARLFVHTAPDERWNGIDLMNLTADYGIDVEHARFTIPAKLHLGFDRDWMRKLYNAFDVLLNPAYGEGFGLPPLEAQACGVPTIVTDFSAMPELQGWGIKVRSARKWWTPLRAFQAVPDIDDIYQALLHFYHMKQEMPPEYQAEFRQRARAFAMDFDIDHTVATFWQPFLETIAEEVRGVDAAAERLSSLPPVRSVQPVQVSD